jgi:hypothetical protein
MARRVKKQLEEMTDLMNTPAPTNPAQLQSYIGSSMKVHIPEKRVCQGHSSPMEYLCHSFLGGRAADAIVWANRGGGKTMLGAVETLLECVFRPGCQVRILGGSLEQSRRMYEHLMAFMGQGFDAMLKEPAGKTRCQFTNGSAVEILTQSARSVRGRHVQRLRCDEVELFDPDVLSAAKFVTQSAGGIPASMEMFSTMHKPYGLMHDEVVAAEAAGRKVFKWCLWEVIEKCTDRSCSQCPLWSDCQGRAKDAEGYFLIDDAIQQMQRASRTAWESEMLCVRPSAENAVFGDFDRSVHIGPVDYDPDLPLYRTIDFGFVNPFVCLWIQEPRDGGVRVIDEYIRSRATVEANIEAMKAATPCRQERVAATFCDPAGAAARDVTGTSAVNEMMAHGIAVRYRKSGIMEGIELIRRALRDGLGSSRLIISPKCVRLIEAMECYHYAEGVPMEIPVKDGVYDHPIDALRYYFVNRRQGAKVTSRAY